MVAYLVLEFLRVVGHLSARACGVVELPQGECIWWGSGKGNQPHGDGIRKHAPQVAGGDILVVGSNRRMLLLSA